MTTRATTHQCALLHLRSEQYDEVRCPASSAQQQLCTSRRRMIIQIQPISGRRMTADDDDDTSRNEEAESHPAFESCQHYSPLLHKSFSSSSSSSSLPTRLLSFCLLLLLSSSFLFTTASAQSVAAPFASVLVSSPNPATPRVDQLYRCLVTMQDPSISYSFSYYWYIAPPNVQIDAVPGGSVYVVSSLKGYEKGYIVKCGVTALDTATGTTYPSGANTNQISSNSITLVNTPPSVNFALLQAQTPKRAPGANYANLRTIDTLICLAQGASDIDDPRVGGTWPAFTGFVFNFTFMANGVPINSQLINLGKESLSTRTYLPNATLPAGTVARGAQVSCSVLASDGQDWADSVTTSTTSTIGVTPLEVKGVTLSGEAGVGSPVLKSKSATCNASSVVSYDHDPPNTWSFSYGFYWKGVSIVNQTSPTLATPGWIRSDAVTCTITATVNVSNVFYVGDRTYATPTDQIVQNTPPVTTGARILPIGATVQSNLTCSATGFFDEDGDNVAGYIYFWTKNGVALSVSNKTNMLVRGVGIRGDVFTCAVASSDGFVFGPPSTPAVLTLANTPPVLLNVSLVFDDPTSPTTATCVPGSIFDADGDPVDAYIYAWTINGAFQPNGSYASQTITAPVLFSLGLANTISCTAIAKDSVHNMFSQPVSTATVILDAPRIINFVAFSPSNKESVYTTGITFNITFNAATNFGVSTFYRNGTTMPKSVVDQLVTFSESLGNDYTGTWVSGSVLQVVMTDVRNNGKPRVGTTRVTPRPVGRLGYNGTNSLFAGASGISPILTGNFGTAPVGFYWGIVTGVDGGDLILPVQFNLSTVGETLTGAATGVSHALFWSSDNHAYGLGLNSQNQLGIVNTNALASAYSTYAATSYVPRLTIIDSLEGMVIQSMAGGRAHSLMLTDKGLLYVAGSTALGQCGVGLYGSQSFASTVTWMELKLDYASLPSGATTYDLNLPTNPINGQSQAFTATNRMWHNIAAGYDYSIVIRTPTTAITPSIVYAFGKHFGAIYNPSPSTASPNTIFPVPQRVSAQTGAFNNTRFTAVAAGLEHAIFLTETGQVYVWGRNLEGQLGLGSPVDMAIQPTLLSLGTGISVVSISAGAYHSILVANSSAVYCFGRNTDGQCGTAADQRRIYAPLVVPTRLFNNSYAAWINAGSTYSQYVNYNGDVYGYGFNEFNALGIAGVYINDPTYMTGLRTASIARVYSTRDISVALTPNKESPCLKGCNNHGSCFDNQCQCTPDWTGYECEVPVCTKVNGLDCAGNGTCVVKDDAPFCACNDRFSGATCLEPSCASTSLGNCKGPDGTANGQCKFGTNLQPYCSCTLGWREPNCGSCEVGFSGTTCSTVDCSAWNQCTDSSHGTCQIVGRKGACVCKSGWVGTDCNTPFCTGLPVCSGHGNCISPTNSSTSSTAPSCSCDDRWTGTQCEQYTCAGSPVCSGQGTCDVSTGTPTCKCSAGFLALDCSIPSCAGSPLNGCSGNGVCVAKDGAPACECDSSHTGVDCSNKANFQSAVLIALIVVAIILVLLLTCACFFFLYRRSVNRYGGATGAAPQRSAGFFDPIAPKSNRIFSGPFQ